MSKLGNITPLLAWQPCTLRDYRLHTDNTISGWQQLKPEDTFCFPERKIFLKSRSSSFNLSLICLSLKAFYSFTVAPNMEVPRWICPWKFGKRVFRASAVIFDILSLIQCTTSWYMSIRVPQETTGKILKIPKSIFLSVYIFFWGEGRKNKKQRPNKQKTQNNNNSQKPPTPTNPICPIRSVTFCLLTCKKFVTSRAEFMFTKPININSCCVVYKVKLQHTS